MQQEEPNKLSRRHVLEVAALSAGATLLGRLPLFANERDILPTAVNPAATRRPRRSAHGSRLMPAF
jgi:hypothetical protein